MASASFVCRACLAGNIRMLQINNKHLKLFEKLTNIEANSESNAGMPRTVCYVCHQLLQKCLLFFDMARRSDKTMRDMLHNGVEITCSTITMLSLATPTLSMAPTQYLSATDYCTEATVEEEQLNVKIEETEETFYEELTMATKENDEVVDSSKQHLSVIDRSNITSTVATVKEEQLDAKIEETQETIYEDLLMATEENDEDVDSSNKLKVKTMSEEETKQTDTILFMYCDNCNKKFFSKHHLVKHLKSHTRKKPYSCSRCDKAFNKKSYLAVHMHVHTGEKPYSCSICAKAFNQKSYLTKHMRVHTGEKPYSCKRCDKAFSQKSHLISHMRVHTGEKPYSCSRCDKEFNQKSNLISHMRVHTGEKPYSCSRCLKAFNQRIALILHTRVHTGEKPYSCSRCDKAFSLKSTLTAHMRVHTGEKPYSCSRCDKAFNQRSALTFHMQVHIGENL